MTFPDGKCYKGSYVKGKKQGKGVKTWANGDTYKGDWVRGKQKG